MQIIKIKYANKAFIKDTAITLLISCVGLYK